MARLPQPGGDTGTWGDVLNEYLSVAHTGTGELKPGSVSADSLADGTVSEAKLTSGVQSKLNTTASVTSVAGKTGAVTLTKSDVGLGNVDNTSDANKPVSTAVQTALNAKADTGTLAAVATSGSYGDLTGRPTIPAAQVNADWDASSGVAQILNKPTLGSAASAATTDFATSAQGAKADTAVQPADLDVYATSSDLTNGLAAKADSVDVYTKTEVDDALGGKQDAGSYLPTKNGNPTLTDSTNDKFVRVDISDDGSATGSWPDRLAFYFNGARTGYFNEYGEIRARPGKSNTVSLRAQKWAGSSTTDIFQVTTSDNATLYFTVGPSDITASVPINSTANISTTGTVSGSNIGNKVTASDSAPSNPSEGDVWIDTSA